MKVLSIGIVEEGILKKWDYVLILAIADIIALLFTDQTSYFSYGYTILLLTASSYVLCKKQAKDLFFAYHFYLLFAIVFYIIFKSQFPEFLGMNGGEGVMDDSRFYAQIVDWKIGYDIPYKYGTLSYVTFFKFFIRFPFIPL